VDKQKESIITYGHLHPICGFLHSCQASKGQNDQMTTNGDNKK